MRTYERFGEAVGAILGTAALAGLLCLFLARGTQPAWAVLWASLVAAAAWFYVADRNLWGHGVALGGQFGLVIVGLAITLALVTGSGWLLLGGLLAAGLVVPLIVWIGDQPGSDLGGPVD
jgi:hypothetical protein